MVRKRKLRRARKLRNELYVLKVEELLNVSYGAHGRRLQENDGFPAESMDLELTLSFVDPPEVRGFKTATLTISTFSANGGVLEYTKERLSGWAYAPSVAPLAARLEHKHPVYITLVGEEFYRRRARIESIEWSSPRPP